MGKQWTKEEIVTLGKLRRSGTSYRAISEVLGRTAGSCQQQAFKLGICKPQRRAQPKRQLEMDLQVAPATKTEFRESPKKQIKPSNPKPWWKRLFGGSDMGAQ